VEFLQQYWLVGLGFFAQGLFGLRLLIQLFLSEREGRSVSPVIFWQLSLVASFLFLIYGILREDVVIIGGQTLSYFIYIRNLQLKNAWQQMTVGLRTLLSLLPFFAWGWIVFVAQKAGTLFSGNNTLNGWVVLGASGLLMLNLRYLYQWYRSEQANESVLPLGFWVISATASVFVVIYGIYRFDLVLLVSQGMGLVVYLRNILLTIIVRRRAIAESQ
jgi:lipid-A-disaccharide synthase-like uncharacterized protein